MISAALRVHNCRRYESNKASRGVGVGVGELGEGVFLEALLTAPVDRHEFAPALEEKDGYERRTDLCNDEYVEHWLQ